MTLPESLKRFRNNFRLSQKQVANAGGVSWQSYQSYESGKASPSVKIIMNIADTYGVSTDYLVGRTDEPRPLKLDNEWISRLTASRDLIQSVLRDTAQVPTQ